MFMFPDSEHFWCCKYWWYSGQRRRQRECHLLSTDASSLWESGPDEWVYKVCHFDNEGCSLWPVCRQQNYKAFSNPNHQNHCAPQRQPSSVELGMFFFFFICFVFCHKSHEWTEPENVLIRQTNFVFVTEARHIFFLCAIELCCYSWTIKKLTTQPDWVTFSFITINVGAVVCF